MKKIQNHFGIRNIALNDIELMQTATVEGFEALCKSLINIAAPVRLSGGPVVKVGTTYTIPASVFYYQGEMYRCAADTKTFTTPPSWKVTQQAPPTVTVDGSPVTYQGVQHVSGGERQVYVENTFALGNDGTIANWDLVREIDHVLFNKINKIGDVMMQAVANTDFDNTGLGKLYTRWEGWALMNGANSTIDMGGFFPVGQKDAVVDYDTIGDTGGAANVLLTAAQSGLREHAHRVQIATAPGSEALAPASTSGTSPAISSGSLAADNVAGRNGAQPALEPHENRPPFKTLRFIQKIA